jgi:hypothetical protein
MPICCSEFSGGYLSNYASDDRSHTPNCDQPRSNANTPSTPNHPLIDVIVRWCRQDTHKQGHGGHRTEMCESNPLCKDGVVCLRSLPHICPVERKHGATDPQHKYRKQPKRLKSANRHIASRPSDFTAPLRFDDERSVRCPFALRSAPTTCRRACFTQPVERPASALLAEPDHLQTVYRNRGPRHEGQPNDEGWKTQRPNESYENQVRRNIEGRPGASLPGGLPAAAEQKPGEQRDPCPHNEKRQHQMLWRVKHRERRWPTPI